MMGTIIIIKVRYDQTKSILLRDVSFFVADIDMTSLVDDRRFNFFCATIITKSSAHWAQLRVNGAVKRLNQWHFYIGG